MGATQRERPPPPPRPPSPPLPPPLFLPPPPSLSRLLCCLGASCALLDDASAAGKSSVASTGLGFGALGANLGFAMPPSVLSAISFRRNKECSGREVENGFVQQSQITPSARKVRGGNSACSLADGAHPTTTQNGRERNERCCGGEALIFWVSGWCDNCRRLLRSCECQQTEREEGVAHARGVIVCVSPSHHGAFSGDLDDGAFAFQINRGSYALFKSRPICATA